MSGAQRDRREAQVRAMEPGVGATGRHLEDTQAARYLDLLLAHFDQHEPDTAEAIRAGKISPVIVESPLRFAIVAALADPAGDGLDAEALADAALGPFAGAVAELHDQIATVRAGAALFTQIAHKTQRADAAERRWRDRNPALADLHDLLCPKGHTPC